MTRPKEDRRLESMGTRNGCPSQKLAFELAVARAIVREYGERS